MYRVLVFFVIVAISYVLANCPQMTSQVPAEKFAGTNKVIKKLGTLDFLGKDCASLTITKKDNNFDGTTTSKSDKKKIDDIKFSITKGGETYKIKQNDKTEEGENFVFLLSNEKTHVVLGCKPEGGNPKYKAFVLGETSDEIDNAIKVLLQPYAVELDKFDNVAHSKEKCDSESGAGFLVPSILTGMIMLLVTKLF